jgi:hypothetical protein
MYPLSQVKSQKGEGQPFFQWRKGSNVENSLHWRLGIFNKELGNSVDWDLMFYISTGKENGKSNKAV